MRGFVLGVLTALIIAVPALLWGIAHPEKIGPRINLGVVTCSITPTLQFYGTDCDRGDTALRREMTTLLFSQSRFAARDFMGDTKEAVMSCTKIRPTLAELAFDWFDQVVFKTYHDSYLYSNCGILRFEPASGLAQLGEPFFPQVIHSSGI